MTRPKLSPDSLEPVLLGSGLDPADQLASPAPSELTVTLLGQGSLQALLWPRARPDNPAFFGTGLRRPA